MVRVIEAGSRAREAAAGTRARRFGDAMRRAREGGTAAAQAAAEREVGARSATSRRAVADVKDAGLDGRRGGFREEERAVASGPLATAPGAAGALVAPEPAGAGELRGALRALPVAIDASRVRDGAPLSLSLGRALDVDLRAAHAGIELVLRPDARLARIAEAELPALVASLRSRGIAVARAEVRARAGAHDARPALTSPRASDRTDPPGMAP